MSSAPITLISAQIEGKDGGPTRWANNTAQDRKEHDAKFMRGTREDD